MKKLLALLCSVAACAYSQVVQQTPHIDLYQPSYGSPGWSTYINANFTILDNLLSGNAPLPGISLPATGVAAGTYGDPTHCGTFTVGTDGRLTAASQSTSCPGGGGGGGSAITGLTGDVAAFGPGIVAATLATVNSNVGTFGSTTQCPTFTVDAKGRITAASQATCAGGSGGLAIAGTVQSEAPSGLINSSNTVFTLSHTPNPTLSLQLSRNGVTLAPGTDYSLTGPTITLGVAPTTGDNLWAWYTYGSGGTIGLGTVTSFTASSGSWPSWLVPSVTTATSTPTLSVAASVIPVAAGGTGTATPGLVAGTNVTITGTWPNQTINSSGGGGGGTITSIIAGTGLTGGGSSGAVTLTAASGAVPNNSVLLGNGSGAFVDGSAAIKNVGGKALFRDYQTALDNGNGSTTGIASGITACGTSTPCTLVVPASYPITESLPGENVTNWFEFSPGSVCTTSSNITARDERYGWYQVFCNPKGNGNSAMRVPIVINEINNDPTAWQQQSGFANWFGMMLTQENLAGGLNINDGGIVNKSNFAALTVKQQNITSGQHIPLNVGSFTGGMGDSIVMSVTSESGGGINAATDEGTQFADIHIGTPAGSYGCTITAIVSNLITCNNTQMPDTQGEQREMIDLTTSVLSSATTGGNISFMSPSASDAETITFSGVTLPSPTVQAKLGTTVSTIVTGPTTVTPTAFTLGSMSGITTSTYVCVADNTNNSSSPDYDSVGGGYDRVKPSAVTGTTFTAVFQRPHGPKARLQVGGLCGRGLDVTADDITSANGPTVFPSVQPVGTVRTIWPVFFNSAPSGSPIFGCSITPCTTALVYNNSGNLWNPITSQFQNISGKNGYRLYPMAIVTAAIDNHGTGDTFTITPTDWPFTVGDAIEEVMGPIQHIDMGIWELHGYQASNSFTAFGNGISYDLPMQGSDSMWTLNNNWPRQAYSSYAGSGAGNFLGPLAIGITGKHKYALHADDHGDFADIQIDCPQSPEVCTGQSTFLAYGNNFGNLDRLNHNGSDGSWQFNGGTGDTGVAVIIPHSGAGGSGYSLGDTFSITQSGASGGDGVVTAISGGGSTGPVTQASIYASNHGTGYSAATGLATTTLTGVGTGLQVDITATLGSGLAIGPKWTTTSMFNPGSAPYLSQPGCTAEYGGSLTVITDSQSLAPGAIILGAGSNKTLAYCVNNQWTVAGGFKPSATTQFTGRTGTLSTSTVCPVSQCVQGNYTFYVPVIITSTGTSGTLTVSATFGDGYSLRTYAVATITDTGIVGSVPTIPVSIHTDGSVPISVSATSTGSTVYNLYPTVTSQ